MLHDCKSWGGAFHLFLEGKDAEVLVGDGVRAEVKGVVMH